MNKNISIKTSENNTDYHFAVNFMQDYVNQILNKNKKDLIWFLNHDHIYTCGTSAKKDEILKQTNIPVIKSNRGGKTTYHGPGQRIIYLMIDLNKRKKDIRKFISLLENSIIDLLREFDIESSTYPDRIGIWIIKNKNKKLIKEKKIGAIGLRLKKWVTFHGLSFNIKPDLEYYKNINACGLVDYEATSLKELGIEVSEKQFYEIFLKNFTKKMKNFL